jgi:hypothetical protein
MKGLILICCLLMVPVARAFVLHVPCPAGTFLQRRNDQTHQVMYSTADSSSSSEEYNEVETQDMRDLILSLSLEPTDHDRRMRLKDIFHEALARPNGMPKRFTDLFDIVLSNVGDDVQSEAKKIYFEAQAAEQENAEESPDEPVEVQVLEEKSDGEGETKKSKSPEELQLWALVDMMVQSKTIVKKETGELGNKGAFQ